MVEFQRIALNDLELAGKGLAKFGQRRQAATVHFYRGDFGTGAQQGAGEAARARSDFEHFPARQISGDGGDPVEQLFVEQEVLAQRLARAEAVTGNHLS